MKAAHVMFGCYLCAECGHIGENCVRTHMRKRDPISRCYVCNELRHIVRNCMNIERIKDDKKEKVDNIRKEMNHKWIRKSPDDEGCSP